MSIVTHIIVLRKNTLTKLSAHKTPIWPPWTGDHEKKPPIRPFVRVYLFNVFVHVTRVELLRRIHECHSNTAKLQFGLSWWRTSQNNSKNIMFSEKFQKKLKSDRFWPFFWPWPWPDPPPGTPRGCLGQLADVISGGSPFKLTLQVDLTSFHFSSDLKRSWSVRMTSQLDKRNLSSWLVKFHLWSKQRCRTLKRPNSALTSK